MASMALKTIFSFIVVVFCFIDHNVEARQGKVFFSKFTHLDRPDNKEVVTLSPAPTPGSETSERFGSGSFGPGSGMIPQTKESWPDSSTTTDEEFEKLMATFDKEKNNQLPEEFEEDEDSEYLNEQKDKYNNNNNNNGYTYTTNNKYDDNRRGYNNEVQRQGMSDTRFVENGKYFYDSRSRNSRNIPSRGYENAQKNDHPNEFETMEEYYKSLEGSQEEFQP